MNRQNKKQIPILTFHKIDTAFEWGVTRITPRQFQSILLFLRKNGYRSISLAQLYDPKFSMPDKPIVLTFDDAYESIHQYAVPLMLEHGFTGTIFVISGYVGSLNDWDVNLGGKKFKHLSWRHLAELRKLGFEIESHGISHSDLTRMRGDCLHRELSDSKKEIEDHIGHEVNFISFPFGRYNARVIDEAIDCCYRKACGYFRKKLDFEKEKFVLERRACYLIDTEWNLKAKLGLSPWAFFENLKLRMVTLGSYGTLLLKEANVGVN